MIKKITIAFAGLYDDNNLGDPVIARCTEEMFTRNIPEQQLCIKRVSLNYYCFHPMSRRLKQWFRIAGLFHIRSKKINEYIIRSDYIRYFKRVLKGVDMVVIVGGGLIEFTGGRFADGMYAITRAGNKLGFPVILNASGVEGYDETNAKCRELKKMLHQPSLKYVSTRDDYDTLINKYFDGHPTTICEKVADPAVWAAEIFGIKRNEKSRTIGIGIVRSDIFQDYTIDFSADQLLELYMNMIKHLMSEGEEVHVFTNGTTADNDFAYKIINKLEQQGLHITLDIPNTAEELIRTIASYKGIIAGRLHSCIISYSLNIPAIGLVWNSKLAFFGKNIGEEANYIHRSDFESATIVRQLNFAIEKGYDQQIRKSFRDTILNSIRTNIETHIKPIL